MFDNNKLGEIRPNQLITTFGPGSIVDAVKDSVTVLDLNYWKEKGKKIIDGRLASYLNVDCFYMPRTSYSGDIPVISFPYMHVCSNVTGAKSSILITGYSLSEYFGDLVDCLIRKSQEGVLIKFFVNHIENQKTFDRLCSYKSRFLKIYNYPKQDDKMSALHAKVISVDQKDTLITSANLSYHGQEGNIELGACIHSKEVAKQVDDLFTKLLFSNIFEEV